MLAFWTRGRVVFEWNFSNISVPVGHGCMNCEGRSLRVRNIWPSVLRVEPLQAAVPLEKHRSVAPEEKGDCESTLPVEHLYI